MAVLVLTMVDVGLMWYCVWCGYACIDCMVVPSLLYWTELDCTVLYGWQMAGGWWPVIGKGILYTACRFI